MFSLEAITLADCSSIISLSATGISIHGVVRTVQQNLFCSRTADIRYVDWKNVFTKELASNSNGSWNKMLKQRTLLDEFQFKNSETMT